MATWKSVLIRALVSGIAVSILLAMIEALHHSDVIGIAQLPGIVVGWGIGATDAAFEITMVLVNAACYALLFGGVFLLVRVGKRALDDE